MIDWDHGIMVEQLDSLHETITASEERCEQLGTSLMETEGKIFNPVVIIEGYDLIISKLSKANKSSKSKPDLIKNELLRKKDLNFDVFIQSFSREKTFPIKMNAQII